MLAAPIAAAPFLLLVVCLGRGETTEFSPNGLCFRTKSVWYIPETNVPIFSWVTSSWPHPLLEMWTKQGYLTNSEPSGDWELVCYWVPHSPMKDTIIHDLTCPKEINFPEYWQPWTAVHPAEASILWPTVIGHIRSRRYLKAIVEMQRYAWGPDP